MMKLLKRNLVLCACLLVLAAGGGCATDMPRLQRVTNAERQQLLNGKALFPHLNLAHRFPQEDIFGLTDQMKRFADKSVAGIPGQDQRIQALLNAVFSPQKLGMKYDEKATLTASEAFKKHRVNCLSFTTFIVPMLRYLGMHVSFNQVDIPPVWDLQNKDMLVLYQHVNAVALNNNGTRRIIDINMEDYDSFYPQRRIDDRTIKAFFYNNRGMESLLDGNDLQAFLYLRKAVDIDPELPFIWTNLGTLYRKHGLLKFAEIAYRLALRINPNYMVAISQAARNYQDLGEFALAEQFRRRARAFRENNPYYLYAQAKNEVLHGKYKSALNHINAAIRRYKREHRFYFLRGVIYTALSERERADASFRKALELTTSQQQKDRYLNKINKLI